MKVAFVAGLSDKKLSQKLAPLQAMPEVDEIYLYRRAPFSGDKIQWQYIPGIVSRSAVLGDLWRLLALLTTGWRCDVFIGCHQKFHGVLANLAASVWHKPVVQMIIGSVDRAYSNWLYRWSVQRSSACAVRGEHSVQQLLDTGYQKPLAVIANPFPLTALIPAPKNPDYTLLAVGNYASAKDYPWMLEVFAALRRHYPEAKLAIAGQGPFQKTLKSQMVTLGLMDTIDFLGWVEGDALDALYRSSQVFLLTSSSEGLPMVVVEAMAQARPVVATTVGELPGFIGESEGLLVPHGNTDAMLAALSDLLGNADKRAHMGRRARLRVESHWQDSRPVIISAQWRKLFSALDLLSKDQKS